MSMAHLPLWLLLLILAGCADTESQADANTDPPLLSAAESGDLTTLSQLLEEHNSPDIRDACRWTPLMKAVLNGHLEAAKRLISAGASVDLSDKGGYTAMMLAASNDHSELVELLIGQGAKVNRVEQTGGWTALIWAAKQGHLETVKVLLDHQADPDITDMQGKRAIDWAQAGNFAAVAALLTSATERASNRIGG